MRPPAAVPHQCGAAGPAAARTAGHADQRTHYSAAGGGWGGWVGEGLGESHGGLGESHRGLGERNGGLGESHGVMCGGGVVVVVAGWGRVSLFLVLNCRCTGVTELGRQWWRQRGQGQGQVP